VTDETQKGEAGASALTEHMFERLAAASALPHTPASLNGVLRELSKWRSHLIQTTLVKSSGVRVLGGPFAGLDFLPSSAEGCHVAKLLGCYEQPLHPAIERAIAHGYDHVVNIGCAEGYYAAGLAQRMPGARIWAFDIDPRARRVCTEMVARNGLAGRITVAEEFKVTDFARFAATRCLVVCDIEGAEDALLDLGLAPDLAHMDLIVEAHDALRPGLSQRLIQRFEATHGVETVTDSGVRHPPAPPPWFTQLSHLDQLLAVWEWRSGPTPWLVCTARQRVNHLSSG
jgi:hypothetical protein